MDLIPDEMGKLLVGGKPWPLGADQTLMVCMRSKPYIERGAEIAASDYDDPDQLAVALVAGLLVGDFRNECWCGQEPLEDDWSCLPCAVLRHTFGPGVSWT